MNGERVVEMLCCVWQRHSPLSFQKHLLRLMWRGELSLKETESHHCGWDGSIYLWLTNLNQWWDIPSTAAQWLQTDWLSVSHLFRCQESVHHLCQGHQGPSEPPTCCRSGWHGDGYCEEGQARAQEKRWVWLSVKCGFEISSIHFLNSFSPFLGHWGAGA